MAGSFEADLDAADAGKQPHRRQRDVRRFRLLRRPARSGCSDGQLDLFADAVGQFEIGHRWLLLVRA